MLYPFKELYKSDDSVWQLGDLDLSNGTALTELVS
jgi:calcineurin-like phosphoesterase family protein